MVRLASVLRFMAIPLVERDELITYVVQRQWAIALWAKSEEMVGERS
jgi:hypothetical protein